MAINERLVHTASAAAGNAGEEGLILHLDANDVDSFDGDGNVWYDIHDHEYTPTTNVSEHFNTVLYNGTGNSVTVDAGFAPDLVWLKRRDSGAASNTLVDTVRGANSRIFSDTTSAELTNGSFSFNSDGTFDTNNVASQSKAGAKHVAWCFKAGGAPTTTNTATSGAMTANSVSIDGTLESAYTPSGSPDIYPDKMSINTDLGFSVIQYGGSGAQETLPHGLGQKPELMIFKRTNTAASWLVSDGTSMGYLDLRDSLTTTRHNQYINSVDANTIELKNVAGINGSSDEMIAYCFTSKRGVSKVGSYIGNGTTNNKIYTGFEPAFFMLKNTSLDNTGWLIKDNVRGENSKTLLANSDAVEYNTTAYWTCDFERDGVRLTYGADNEFNRNGDTYIFYAVAKDTNETSLIPDTDLELNLEADSYSGSGNWLDSSGNGNNGTITGATWEKELGNFFEFNGSSDKVEGSISGIGSQFTVELWVSPNDFTGNENLFELYDSATDASNNRIFFSGGSLLASKNGGGGGFAQKTSITSVMTIGKWHHVVARYDSNSSIKLYVDTVKVAEDLSVSGTFNIANFAIGVNNDYTQGERNFANAKIGQVRVYDTILTEAQIRQNFNFTKPKYPNEFHGDITGATWNASGYFDFDGSNDNVSITSTANSPIDFTAKNYTITAWINPDTSGVNQIFTKYGSSDSLRSVSVLIHSDNKLRLIQRTSTSDNSYSTSTISQNTWTHIAVTRSSSDVKFYINGQLDNTVSNTFTPNSGGSQDVMIGANGSGTPSYFNGQISKVKAYNAVLTQAEIDALYGEGY